METIDYTQMKLGEIVTADFRTASVFKEAGIDFCCGGNKTFEEACNEKNIEAEFIINKLHRLVSEPTVNGQNFNEWDLDFLADYILNTHHKYVLKTLPELSFYTQKIANVHGSHHSELIEVADLFGKINTDLIEHLHKEEEIVFPTIKVQLKSKSISNKELLRNEIEILNGEHEFAGDSMDRIRELTKGYKVPNDACNTYKVTLEMLEQFENDLHIHVHLENNILFPKALKL